MYLSSLNRYFGTFMVFLLLTSCKNKYDLREEKLGELIGIRNQYSNSIDSINVILNNIENSDSVAVDTTTIANGRGSYTLEELKELESSIENADNSMNEFIAQQRRLILLKSSRHNFSLKLKFVKASIDSIKEMDELN
ncbi:hypothetical protein EWU22_05370 [Aquirufa nivalisilvae]|nr:hypothetical protein EWU22_05370 [Aquirufa nivalisilvae]